MQMDIVVGLDRCAFDHWEPVQHGGEVLSCSLTVPTRRWNLYVLANLPYLSADSYRVIAMLYIQFVIIIRPLSTILDQKFGKLLEICRFQILTPFWGYICIDSRITSTAVHVHTMMLGSYPLTDMGGWQRHTNSIDESTQK